MLARAQLQNCQTADGQEPCRVSSGWAESQSQLTVGFTTDCVDTWLELDNWLDESLDH